MKAISIIIAMFIFTSSTAQKIKTYNCFWYKKNVDEFQAKFNDFKYSEKGMFYYYISNDRNNIYIDLRIFDDNIKRVITRSGITVWLNTDGKKNKTLGVRYPVGNPGIKNSRSYGLSEKPLPQIDHAGTGNEKALPEPEKDPDFATNSLLLIGFDKSGPQLLSSFENDNFRGSVNYQKEYMFYQLILPISKVPALKKNSDKKKEYFVIGLSHGSFQSTNMGGGGGGMRGGGSGGMRGGGGGRMRGGGGGRMYGGGGGTMTGGGGTRPSASGSESAVIVWINNIKLAIGQ